MSERTPAIRDQIFESNKRTAQAAMGSRYTSLDWNLVQERRDKCTELEKQKPWTVCPDNFLVMPQLFPVKEETVTYYESLNEGFQLGGSIEQYINLHGKDPHLLIPLLNLRDAIIKQEFDPAHQVTSISGNYRPYFLVAFGTGDGKTLLSLIRHFKPHHIVIGLSDWHDFATSFWDLDWQELCNYHQNQCGGKITIGCYKNELEVFSLLSGECLAGVDHTIVYLPPEGACSPLAHQARERITSVEMNQTINYLGYTVDEHNMVWNTWQTLSKQPRVLRKPRNPLGDKMVVCGSGPSLDSNIELLKEMSKSYIITACGSNFRTLKANNIRVDVLSLVERADETYLDIKEVIDEYGCGNTRLVMSTTCHHQLLDLFEESMVYFRPALTPLSVFSGGPAEILDFEGPESINSGVAFASAIGISELVLVGVDLGARSLKKTRSSSAVGCSVRELNLEVTGNFGGTVFTSSLLRDSKISVESCLKTYPKMKVYNASDGVNIVGAKPKTIKDILKNFEDLPSENNTFSSFDNWWFSSSHYSLDRFHASWKSRRPRAETSTLINQLKDLFASDLPWSPSLIKEAHDLLSLDVPSPGKQFPRRVIRSTIHKLIVAINRQIIVMSMDPQKSKNFELEARQKLYELLQSLEIEIYSLCDAVEMLPA